MAPTSTHVLLSAVHSTIVLTSPSVTPSATSPTGTTVFTHVLWKGGFVCFAIAIISVVGYFYRRRRKSTMTEPKSPRLVLPAIVPRNGAVPYSPSAFINSPSDSPYSSSQTCVRSVLESASNQLVKHSTFTRGGDVTTNVTESDREFGVNLPVTATTVIAERKMDLANLLSSRRDLVILDRQEDGIEREEADDDISIYSSESADTALHDSMMSETAEPHGLVPEIACEYHMTVVTCDYPVRSYNFDIPIVGTTIRGGAFLTLPGSLPSPSTVPTGPRSPVRRYGLAEMSNLASALAVQLNHPSSDVVLEEFDMHPIDPTTRRHGQVDLGKYVDTLHAETVRPLRCRRFLEVPHVVREEEVIQESNSPLMDDLLQSIDEEFEFYSNFDADEECDDISDTSDPDDTSGDTCSARKHTSPTWNCLDFLEGETCSFAADDDVDFANKHFSPTLDYLEFLDDEMRIFQASSEDSVSSPSSKQGIHSANDELTPDPLRLSTEEAGTTLGHDRVSAGGGPEAAILDLIRLLDEEAVHYQQSIHDPISEGHSDGFDLLRFINEDLRPNADDGYPIVDFDREDDCDDYDDDDYPRFAAVSSSSNSSLSDTEDRYIDDYDSPPSLASASDMESEDEEVIISPIGGRTTPWRSGSNHRRSPAGCFIITPGTPMQHGDLIDAGSCINVADGEPHAWGLCKSFVEAYAPFTEAHGPRIPINVDLAFRWPPKLDLDIRFP